MTSWMVVLAAVPIVSWGLHKLYVGPVCSVKGLSGWCRLYLTIPFQYLLGSAKRQVYSLPKCGSRPPGIISLPSPYPNTDHRFTLNAWSITTPEKKLRPGCPCRRIYSPIISMCNTLANSGIFISGLPASPVNRGTWYICRYRVLIFGGLLGSNFPSNTCHIAVS